MSQTNAQWGGRFAAGPSAIMAEINASIGFDAALWRQDIAGSRAHAKMLVRVGIIDAEDGRLIDAGLEAIATEIAAGTFAFEAALEDIHMNIEARLIERIGDPGRRLHTARSRNDQVATDMRLWVRDAIDGLLADIAGLMRALVEQAARHAGDPMPGFTHLQTAQPVTFGHHLLAYVEMLERDRGRLSDCRRRLNECPLGAAALAGTSFPIDREMTARALGFDRPTANSLDSVADRDFALEFLAAASIGAMHLSRLAEELVIWCSAPFGFVRLSDAFTTGSSIMPQKRNPDAAELVRAKTGRINGALVALLTMMKGLPLAYAKDMQEDKEPVFDAARAWALCLAAMAGMVADMTPDAARMRALAGAGYATATDLADWLVRAGLPFRAAHHATGRIVALAERRGVDLAELPLADLQAIEPRLTADIFGVLTVDASVASRTSFGGTAPASVAAQAAKWALALPSSEANASGARGDDAGAGQHVVRGGAGKARDFEAGTAGTRNGYGFSVQTAPDTSVGELARGGRFRNRRIAVSTTTLLQAIPGVTVNFPTPGRGEYHGTVNVPDPPPPGLFDLIESAFTSRPNPCPASP